MLGRLSGSLREAWRQRSDARRRGVHAGAAGDATPEQLFLRARAMARAGDLVMAAKFFEEAAALDSNFVDAMEAHAEALDLSGQSSRASELYDAARQARARVRPGAPDRHFVLRQKGRFAAQIFAYESVLRSLKKNALPYMARGNAYLADGNPTKALADYQRALKLKANPSDINVLKGEALVQLRRYKDAVHSFDAALAARPHDSEGLGGRAIARMALGLVDAANADWDHQFRLLVNQPAARACIALRKADYATAIEQLEEALVREPEDPYWQLYLTAAALRAGRPRAPEWEGGADESWPGPLRALHAGRLEPDAVLARANSDCRRAEALFQLGVMAFDRDPEAAIRYWRELVATGAPWLIEFAAAKNELARLGS